MNDPTLISQTVAVVLPCYNPSEGWTDRVVRAWKSLSEKMGRRPEMLVLVNDGSTRNLSPDNLEWLRKEIPELLYIPSQPNKGKGHALRLGVDAAQTELIVFTDIDFPYEEEGVVDILRVLAFNQADVVPGVRDESYYENVPNDRKRISRLLRWMLRTFLKLQVTDTQCGLKGFNQVGRDVFLKTTINRFLFDLEFIFLASRAPKIRVQAVPVKLKPGIQFSHVSLKILLREGLNFLKVFFRALIA